MAVVSVGESGNVTIGFESSDLAISMTTQDELPGRVERQPVRSWFLAFKRSGAAIAAVPEKQTDSLARLPSIDGIGRNVREEEITALFVPDRPFDPAKSIG